MESSEFWTQALTIVGPIVTTFIVGLKMSLKSMQTSIESLKQDLNALNVRCEKNHGKLPQNDFLPVPPVSIVTGSSNGQAWIDEMLKG